MKRCAGIVLLISCVTFCDADAQTAKGSFMIGGTGSLIGTRRHEPPLPPNSFRAPIPNTTFSISPIVGYFFINNLMTGLTTSFSYAWNTTDPGPRTRIAGVGPVLRYYFPFGKFAVFPEVAGIYTWQRLRSIGREANGSLSTFIDHFNNSSYRAGGGIAWFVAPNVGIEAIAAYRQINHAYDTSWQAQLYLTLAIQFYIPAKN